MHAETPRAEDQNLATLAAAGRLRNLPPALLAAPPRIPARSPAERAALGYLHGNCGHCHAAPGATDAAVPVPVLLAQYVADAESSANVLRSLVGAASRFKPQGGETFPVVAAGRARASVLTLRLRSRDPRVQMPPLGTVLPDSDALALIERWIDHDLVHAQGAAR